MSKGNVTENDFVKFLAHGTAMPTYGGTLYVHLHTADPGEAGTGATNECAYDDYVRVGVTRDVTGWTICDADGTPNAAGSAFKNAAEVTFPECGSGFVGTETATHGSLCTASGQLLYKSALTTPIVVAALNTPRIVPGGAIFKEN